MNPEEFSELMQTAYEEALLKADMIVNEAKGIMNNALGELEKAKLEGIKKAAEWLEAQKGEIKEHLREEILSDLIKTNLNKGKSVGDIAEWFQIKEDVIEEIKLKMDKSARLAKNEKRFPMGTPVLSYENLGRGGTIYFDDGLHKFSMWWEFGGGEVVAIVELPTSGQWVDRTGISLEQMPSIIEFIGSQILDDQFSGSGYYMVTDNALLFYGK